MSTQNNKDAVIDQARLESITGSDKAVISDLMKLFVESTQKLLNDIQKDIQLHDSLQPAVLQGHHIRLLRHRSA